MTGTKVALKSMAAEFFEKSSHAQKAQEMDGPLDEEGLGHLEDKSDDELEGRAEAYREAANRCRDLAERMGK